MRKEEILNMPAGRAMDALVAKEVTKWIVIKEETYQGIKFLSGVRSGKNNQEFIPLYSTDISAAWEIVDKFDYFKIVKSFGMKGTVWIIKTDENNEVFEKSLPLAICRAALLTTIGENE